MLRSARHYDNYLHHFEVVLNKCYRIVITLSTHYPGHIFDCRILGNLVTVSLSYHYDCHYFQSVAGFKKQHYNSETMRKRVSKLSEILQLLKLTLCFGGRAVIFIDII